jgi:glycosyltransferase involved in cell wall biosynthesis
VQAILRALPAIQEKIPGVHLDILGDGEYRPILEELTSVSSPPSSVAFHGNVNHETVLKKLSQSHIFVFPTRIKEEFPKAVLEALACGLPVIAARVSVIPRLLQNGCGLILSETTPECVSEAVLQLATDPVRLKRMGGLAREAAQGYTLEAWGEEIRSHLEQAWGPLRTSA